MAKKLEKNRNEIGKPAVKYPKGKNPNSLANLEIGKAKKGDVLNPEGRPVGSKNLSTLLKEMLQVIAPDEIISSKFVKEFCGKIEI